MFTTFNYHFIAASSIDSLLSCPHTYLTIVTKHLGMVNLSPSVTVRQGRPASTITNTPDVALMVFTMATLL